MPTGTPRLERIKEAVTARFPDAIYGQYNCRPRNALGWWSQHAGSEPAKGYRGNAVDIVHKDHGYGDTSPAHQAWLDKVNAYLEANREALDLNELIWRKRNHFDHIHTSPWPKMHDPPWYTPPCKGGKLVVRFADKTRGDTFDVHAPPPPPPTLDDEMGLRRGDTGNAVAKMQKGLLAWREDVLPEFGADADYGGETETAVSKYQKAADLDAAQDFGTLGVADATTIAFILSNLTGEKGDKGDQGDDGDPGPEGDPGPQGDPGDPGPQPTSATFTYD